MAAAKLNRVMTRRKTAPKMSFTYRGVRWKNWKATKAPRINASGIRRWGPSMSSETGRA